MFERYTEQARRTLFFARDEASQLGSLSIEAEHLLLGLIRVENGFTSRILAASHLTRESVCKDIEARTTFHEQVSTSVEIPFSAETKRVLVFAVVEADSLLHNHIGTEHLLLGLLREKSFAASILQKTGITLAGFRDQVAAAFPTGEAGPGDRSDAAMELEQVKRLVDRLASSLSDQDAANELIEQIRFNLERLQDRFRL